MEIAAILFSFLTNQLIIYLLLKNQPIGSDHYYHVNLINHIRENNHRFISEYHNTLINPELAYPQFYHWILSFLSPRLIDRCYRWFIFLFAAFSYWGFILFLGIIRPYYPDHQLMVWCPLIFVLTPFHYDIRNAKNAGLSVRGLGLMLGQFYLYSIVIHVLSGQVGILLISVVLAMIILMANKYAFQFVALSTPLLALFFLDIYVLLIPAIAVILYLALFPTQARQNLKGQVGHKKLYYQYLADRFLLKERYSIWRDLVRDIYLKFRGGLMAGLEYAYGNSVVTLIRGFPFLVLLLLYFTAALLTDKPGFSHHQWIMAAPVLTAFLLFWGTSFRKTRFLGEPERYIEFFIGIIAVAAVFYFSRATIVSVLCLSILLILFELFLPKLRVKRLQSHGRPTDSLEFLIPEIGAIRGEVGEIRLLSNAYQVLKRFYAEDVKICFGELASEWFGDYHFTDVFPDDLRYFNPDILSDWIKRYHINVLIVDGNTLPDVTRSVSDPDIELCLRAKRDHLTLYTITLKPPETE